MVIYINERFLLKKKYHTFFVFYKIEFDKKIYYVIFKVAEVINFQVFTNNGPYISTLS
jgi:hypothetical protein